MRATISRATVTGLVGLALTTSGFPMALAPAMAITPAAGEGYCRRPAALPDLGPEVEPQQVRPPAPMPRPTPVPPRPMLEKGGSEGGAVTVTAHRERSDADAAKPMAPPPPPPAPPPPPPPPPPPVMAAPSAPGASDVSAARVAAPVPMPTSPVPPGWVHQPPPQSGLLTAGEHDDLLNPELYAEYVRGSDLGQSVKGLPVLDTARLITVEVKDNKGRPAPMVPVTLRCSDGNTLTFTTQADGTAVFFPKVDRLSDKVSIRVGEGKWRAVDVADSAGTDRIGFRFDGTPARVTKLDLGLVVDVTGSMSDELRFLQAELDSIVASLNERHPELDIRVGMTFYRDKGDDYVTRTYGFTGDMARAREQIGQQSARGGGDYEEAMQDALVRAAQQKWRDDAIKTLLVVADAPPHAEDVPLTWLATEHLRAERVQIVPVGASGVGPLAEYVMRAMAAATQSRYAFLTDDSGIGNPHAPPAIDCYLVTRLDQLLTRIIDSQVSGRRIEPDKADVIREVGQYDGGKCVLPKDFGKAS